MAFHADIWREFFDNVLADHAAEKIAAIRPAEPITLEEMASLVNLDVKTLRHWATKGGRPDPIIPHHGKVPAVYSYTPLRTWVIKNRADLETWLPVDYADARKLLD